MNNIKKTLATMICGVLAINIIAHASTRESTIDVPTGYWKTIDDVTGKPKSIIYISKAENNILTGKVIKIFPKQGNAETKLCTACAGEKHNQPIVGMVILSGLKADQNRWDQGHILDPENGKTYRCSVRVTENGKKLNVHGYIGIPLLGRSQLWERVDAPSAKA